LVKQARVGGLSRPTLLPVFIFAFLHLGTPFKGGEIHEKARRVEDDHSQPKPMLARKAQTAIRA